MRRAIRVFHKVANDPAGLRRLTGSFFLPLFILASICLHGGIAPAAGNVIKVTDGGRVSADIVDSPLTQVLADLSQSVPIEIKGIPDRNDRVTLHFSRLTVQEALRKIMAGYNYVVIKPQPAGGRLSMTILGKAGKSVREAASPPEAPSPPDEAGPPPAANTQARPAPATATLTAPSPASPASPAQPPAGRSVLPSGPVDGQPPVAAANPAPTAEAAATSPEIATTATPPGVLPAPSDQPEFNPAAWGGKGRHK